MYFLLMNLLIAAFVCPRCLLGYALRLFHRPCNPFNLELQEMLKSLQNLVIVAASVVCYPAFAQEKDTERDRVFRKVALSTVLVQGNCPASGFLIDREQRLVVTSMLTVLDKSQVLVMFPVVENGRVITEGPYYGKRINELFIPAKVLHVDTKRRIALIQPVRLSDDVQALTLASEAPKINEPLYAVGDSMLDGHFFAVYEGQRLGPAVQSNGVNMFNTTLHTKQLDWGCPVVNASGELVGMVSNGPNNVLPNEAPRVLDQAEILAMLKNAGIELDPNNNLEDEFMKIISNTDTVWHQYVREMKWDD